MQLFKFIILVLLMILSVNVVAQTPSGFKYQAVVRDMDGNPLRNTETDVRLSIHTEFGDLVYSELHTENITNEFGIIGLTVGSGVREEGPDFREIDWAADPHSLSVELRMPEVQDGEWVFYGSSQILTVPIAMYAHSVRDKDDADADPNNEMQNLSLVDNVLSISDGNSVTLSSGSADEQILSLEGTNLSITGGNTVNLEPVLSQGGDPSSTNEIQTLSLDGNILSISGDGGNNIELPQQSAPQSLELNGNELSISEGNTVTLNPVVTENRTDEIQQLELVGNELTITGDGGNTITIPTGGTDADADPTNEIQSLNFDLATNELSLSSGNTVIIPTGGTDADADPTNEIQRLNFDVTTNELSLTNGNTVMIPTGSTDADADPTNEIQTISFDPGTSELSLTDGGVVVIPTGGTDADADPTNEIQTISFDPGTSELSLTDGGVVVIPTGGTDADADPTNEIQSLSFDVATNELSLTDGNTVTIPTGSTDADADPTNEIQTISFDPGTSELSLTDGGVVVIPTGGTDADADPANELQTISRDGTRIILENGGEVDLATIIPTSNDDNQTFTTARLDGTDLILEIEDGNQVTIDLSSLRGSSSEDNQQLSLDATTGELSLRDGGSVDLSTLVDEVDDADADPTNELQNLSFDAATNELSLTNGNSITIPAGGTDADADPLNEIQDLIFNDSSFEIGLTGTNNTIDLSRLSEDADADPFNELQWLTYNAGFLTINDNTGSSQSVEIGDTRGGSNSPWSENGSNINYSSGNVGIGTNNPRTNLDVAGGQWNLDEMNGDFRIGNSERGLRIGVAVGDGPGGGNVQIRAQGGTTNGLRLGSGDNEVLIIEGQNVRVPRFAGVGTRNLSVDPSGNLTTESSSAKTKFIGANQFAGEDAIYDYNGVFLPESGHLYSWIDIPPGSAIEKIVIYYYGESYEFISANISYNEINTGGTLWGETSTIAPRPGSNGAFGTHTFNVDSPLLMSDNGFWQLRFYSEDWDDNKLLGCNIFYK